MIWLILYALGFVLSLVPLVSAFRRVEPFNADDVEDRVFTYIMAVIVGAFWPLVLIGWGAMLLSRFAWSFVRSDKTKEPQP